VADGLMQSGKDWMRRPIEFNHVKMTNNPQLEEKHMVFVQSLHKYTPFVEIFDEQQRNIRWQRLDIASFITVTAYQNNAVSQLKKYYNKYAKGQYNKSVEQQASLKRPPSSPLGPPPQVPPPSFPATPYQASPTQPSLF
ncbi:hypothetical protein PENTCL1PPCAC_10587, partial [Pristionchus entomophagus]